MIAPGNLTIWAGIGFDNDDGATPITAAQLNALGGSAYHPATVGTDGPQAYYIGPYASLSDPTIIACGTTFGENYGWNVQASVQSRLQPRPPPALRRPSAPPAGLFPSTPP